MTSETSAQPDRSTGAGTPLLEVEDLRVHFKTERGVVKAVDGVNWHVNRGETLAIVGESGSGKSVSAMSILGLVPSPPAEFPSGDIRLDGTSLLSMPEHQQRKLRGREVSMIFQDPLTALNPVFTIGNQIVEMIRQHQPLSKHAARKRTLDLLGEVGIPNPKARIDQYPHEFSGGMRQRAMIAMALANDPQVLLADEPTTALDVTVQAQIMALLTKLQDERGTAIVLITHDLGLVASHADRIAVMYAGRIVETGTADEIFYETRHAYTLGLLNSLPRLDARRQLRLTPIPGAPPNLSHVPPGCAFNPRCGFATQECLAEVPPLVELGGSDHATACVHHTEVLREREARAEKVELVTSGAATPTGPGADPEAGPASETGLIR